MQSYGHELVAFVATLQGRQAPDRPLDHELLVEETLHRAVGTIDGDRAAPGAGGRR